MAMRVSTVVAFQDETEGQTADVVANVAEAAGANTDAIHRPRPMDARVEPWIRAARSHRGRPVQPRRDRRRASAGARRAWHAAICDLPAAATSAREVADAAIQAAAIWFDADARVYRRQPSGVRPGGLLFRAPTSPEANQLSELVLGLDAPFVRSAPLRLLAGGLSSSRWSRLAMEWALVLLGAIPPKQT